MKKELRLSLRLRSVLVGIFILIAYGVLVSAITESRRAVMAADVVSGAAVIGIALLMHPLFRESGPVAAWAYLILKFAEGLLMIAAGILYLTPSTGDFRDLIYNGIHLYVFIVSAGLFYLLLYRSRLIPAFISFWGAAGILSLAVSTVFELAGMPLAFLEYFLVLIITNEVFLAVWLLARGLTTEFRSAAIPGKMRSPEKTSDQEGLLQD